MIFNRQVPMARTPGHQENNNFAAVSNEHQQQQKQQKLILLILNWFPIDLMLI